MKKINKINKIIKIKKILAIPIYLLFIIFSVISFSNATVFYDNQQTILNELNNIELQSTIQPDILSNISSSSAGYSFSLTSKPLYISFYSINNDTVIQLNYHNLGQTSINSNLNLQSKIPYYVKFTPQSSNDYLGLTIQVLNGSSVSYSILNLNDNGKGFATVTNTLVGAMTDLININLGFWKLIYYLFIFAIIITGIGLLVSFSFKFYDWTERASQKKKDLLYGRDGNNSPQNNRNDKYNRGND